VSPSSRTQSVLEFELDDAVTGHLPVHLIRTLNVWFNSPFWGFPVRRGRTVVVRPALTARPGDDLDRGPSLRLVEVIARTIRRTTEDASDGGAGSRPKGPSALCDSFLADRQGRLLDAADLVPTHPLDVVVGGRHLRVEGVAGLVALALLLRLDFSFGEGLLRALQPFGGSRRLRRDEGAAVDGIAVSPQLLLPTIQGSLERERSFQSRTRLLVPALAYPATVGHLLGSPSTIHATGSSLQDWFRTERSLPSLESAWASRTLALRQGALRAVRVPLSIATAMVARLPWRPPRSRLGILAGLLDGSLAVMHSRHLIPATERPDVAL
jgi:hypothetical protein